MKILGWVSLFRRRRAAAVPRGKRRRMPLLQLGLRCGVFCDRNMPAGWAPREGNP